MQSDRKLTTFFYEKARVHRVRYLAAFAMMPLTAGLAAGWPQVMRYAIDHGIAVGNSRVVVTLAFCFLAAVVLHFFLQTAMLILIQTAGVRTLHEIRAALIYQVSHLGKSVYERYPLGVFVSRSTSDIEAIKVLL